MSSVPAWIQILQALLTPAVAVAVAIIGYLQWRTAHQKVVLDVFDRRIKVYDQIEEAISEALRAHDNQAGLAAGAKFLNAWRASRFLFREDVQKQILETRRDCVSLQYHRRQLEKNNLTDKERELAAQNAERFENKLFDSPVLFSNLFAPYLRMDQKRVRTPMEWLKYRNSQRLSHADEKQR